MKTDLVYGIHAIQHLLKRDPQSLLDIWIQDSSNNPRLQVLREQIQALQLPLQIVPRKTLDKLTQQAAHQGIVVRCRIVDNGAGAQTLEDCIARATTPPLLLVLDGVQDPHNLGACLRTADAAGVHAVIVPKDRACSLSPTVRKVACGAAETVPLIRVSNLATTLRSLKDAGIWLSGLADDASQSLYQVDFSGPTALILGAEGEGLRRLTRSECDYLLSIPMMGQVESLNVSVAAAVCLYEAVRQRS